jgi:hypothetical protein
MSSAFSRRKMLQGAAAMAGAAAAAGPLGRLTGQGDAWAQTAEQPAVVLVFLRGGYNALFGSADSFASAGTFGCAPGNVKSLGNGLVVDNATFGTLPASAQTRMATIGINHGLSSHDPARLADWTNGSRSYALMLANALGGTAAIRCAVVGNAFPDGPRPTEGGVSMQMITDLSSTLNAITGGTADSTRPDRPKAAAGLTAARGMSNPQLNAQPVSLKSAKEAYDASITLMQQPTQGFDYATIAQAYGISATSTAVNSFRSKMLAAEVMIRAGCRVVMAIDGGWDTHGDSNGSNVRNMMNTRILPGLNPFLQRMLTATGRNVTVGIFGDFARSLPGSDHAKAISGTVIGKYVKVGTTGKMSATVGLPSGSPSVPAFWSYLAAVSKAPTNPFGNNPHASLVLP